MTYRGLEVCGIPVHVRVSHQGDYKMVNLNDQNMILWTKCEVVVIKQILHNANRVVQNDVYHYNLYMALKIIYMHIIL